MLPGDGELFDPSSRLDPSSHHVAGDEHSLVKPQALNKQRADAALASASTRCPPSSASHSSHLSMRKNQANFISLSSIQSDGDHVDPDGLFTDEFAEDQPLSSPPPESQSSLTGFHVPEGICDLIDDGSTLDVCRLAFAIHSELAADQFDAELQGWLSGLDDKTGACASSSSFINFDRLDEIMQANRFGIQGRRVSHPDHDKSEFTKMASEGAVISEQGVEIDMNDMSSSPSELSRQRYRTALRLLTSEDSAESCPATVRRFSSFGSEGGIAVARGRSAPPHKSKDTSDSHMSDPECPFVGAPGRSLRVLRSQASA
mmetsp:Transcript_122873/g.393613  ORF Transcript_122873/g.393613 Transcript_122873/m.393613 type:complete len:316 (-) Transcript_122873:209-1156(-)